MYKEGCSSQPALAPSCNQTEMARRVVMNIDAEYQLAKAIMQVVTPAIAADPKINTCKVRQLCEMMLEW